jgi:hypothetical protein
VVYGMGAVMATFPHPTVLTCMQYAVSATYAAGTLLSSGTPLTQLLNVRKMLQFLPTAVLFYTSVLSSKYILQVVSSTSRAAAAWLPSLLQRGVSKRGHCCSRSGCREATGKLGVTESNSFGAQHCLCAALSLGRCHHASNGNVSDSSFQPST